MQALGLAAGLVSALVFGLAAVAQAHGVRHYPRPPDTLLDFVRMGVRDPWTLLVVGCYLTGFVLHAVAIALLPLYLAQTTVAMSLPVTALAASWVDRRLPARRWAAVLALTAGLVLVSAGSGGAGDVRGGGVLAALVAGAVLALAVAGLLARRRGGGLLGLLAGLGYAGSAVAVRGIDGDLDVAVVTCALAVPAFSLVAFWQYSLGMRRAAVAVATAPLIGAQTLVPAAVGVIWLGDRVRDGWWPAVAVGVTVAMVAAVVLSAETEQAPDPGEVSGEAAARR